MSEQLIGVIIGASAAIIGGVIGGFVQGWAWYRFEIKRAARQEKKRWIKIALEWAETRPFGSLRRADLEGADLRGVDLGRDKRTGKCADLSYANLRAAYLKEANLNSADLRGADLREARLRGANLEWAVLNSADLRGANLKGVIKLDTAKLRRTKYNNDTIWPEGFSPPPEAVKVEG